MASPDRREDGRQASSPGSPDFCKLILPETLLLDKLKIPKKFVKKYGNTLSDSVYLEVPSGKVWQIDLTRNDKGKVWLENGWKMFLEYYSLGTGHMVAFRYQGNSNFYVFIFDMNSSEIDYRPNDICGEERKTPTDPISVEILDDFDPHTPPQKRTSSTSGTNNGANVLHPLASPVNPECTQSNRLKLGETKRKSYFSPVVLPGGNMSTGRQRLQSKVPMNMKRYTADEKARAFGRADCYEMENPYFKVFMQPSYIQGGFKLNIPVSFVLRHFPQRAGNVTLSTSDGRTWLAKYTMRESNNKKEAVVYGQWRAFAKDNDLKAGDVCVFEMIKSTEVSLKVVIFRETSDANYCPSSQAHTRVADVISVENLDDFDPQTPPQKRKRSGSTSETENGVHLPHPVASQFTAKDTQSGRTKLKKCKRNLCPPMKVVSGLGVSAGDRRPESEVPVNMKKFNVTEKARALLRASAFKSENPCFKVFLQRSYIDPGSKLILPEKFVDQHLNQKAGDVTLITSDGRTWSAKYEVERRKRAKLYNGWKVFVGDNGLKAGDVCVFEMIDCLEIKLRVLIFRETLDANCSLSEAHMSVADVTTDNGTKATDNGTTATYNGTRATDNGTMDVEMVNSESDACVDNLDESSPRKKQEVGAGGGKHARRQQPKSKAFESMRSLTSTEKAMYLRKAMGFKSDSPFFMIVMQPSYVLKGNKLNIPADFARRHFDFGNGDVILFTSDGRTWPGKYKMREENTKRNSELYSGWKAFAKDNGLKVGDVCVFELKRGTKAILRVVIFRETDNANSPLAQGERVELKKSTESEMDPKYKNATSVDKAKGRNEQMTHKDRASCGQRPSSSSITRDPETNDEKYPSFRIFMSQACLRRRDVNVPTSFARKIIKNGTCNVRLQVGDRFWRVKLICNDNFKRGLFSKGWVDFVKQNAIQEGDACDFELINYNDGIIKVSVSREPEMEAERENASTVDNMSSSSPSQSQEVKGTNNVTMRPTTSSSQEVEDKCGQTICKEKDLTTIDEKSPSFRAVMSPSSLEHGSVCVPVAFARKFIRNGDHTVKLKIGDRLWPVKLKNYERKACFSKGWNAFMKQNALKLGDTCEFELINKEDGIIEVSISRVSS